MHNSNKSSWESTFAHQLLWLLCSWLKTVWVKVSEHEKVWTNPDNRLWFCQNTERTVCKFLFNCVLSWIWSFICKLFLPASLCGKCSFQPVILTLSFTENTLNYLLFGLIDFISVIFSYFISEQHKKGKSITTRSCSSEAQTKILNSRHRISTECDALTTEKDFQVWPRAQCATWKPNRKIKDRKYS